jgi:hypothetical protein
VALEIIELAVSDTGSLPEERVSSGAKAPFFRANEVGAKAPTF